MKKITSKSILALRETEGGGLLLPPNFCQTCGSSFFCIALLFLYFYISWIPFFHISWLLNYFPFLFLQIVLTGHFYLQIVVTNHFSNGRTRSTFFPLQIAAHITCICKVLYNLTLLSGGLKTDLLFILIKLKVRIMLCRWCVCARGHVSCQRGAERGYIGPHNVRHETHESHHQVNMKPGREHKKKIGSAHFSIQNR